jgi:protoporphyrinogen/coproporphyrinogen III oxidase
LTQRRRDAEKRFDAETRRSKESVFDLSSRLETSNPVRGESHSRHVVIVGGGIAGLSAAWYLQREAQRNRLALSYTLLEGSARWGGKIVTEQVEGFGGAPFVIEGGPDAFLTRKPAALTLARELGLENRILGVNRQNRGTFVLSGGELTPLPDGLSLLVPTKLRPFLRSPLFSPLGKLRMLLEVFVPPKRDDEDETLAGFVRRRLGAEALDKLAEPLLAGIYNSDTEHQSILATFPQFPALEKKYGSLIRGTRAAKQEQPAKTDDSMPAFISFETGTHELVDALVPQLTGDLRLNASVQSIEQGRSGGFSVTLDDGTRINADAVILATPAKAAAWLTKAIAPDAAKLLSEIRYASIGALTVGFRREDVRHPMDGYGVVIPSSEGRRIDGMTWTSSKWDKRAPEGYALMRVFFGGPHTRDMMALDDTALLDVINGELRDLMGITAKPLFTHVRRWQDAYPQYDLGHLDRVAAIEALLPAGIYVTGSSYRGIGVPDCIKQGQATAQHAVAAMQEAITR